MLLPKLRHVRVLEHVVIIIKWTIIANYVEFSRKNSVWLMIGIVHCYFTLYNLKLTSNSSLKTHSNYLASLLGLEEPSLKLLRLAELQHTNSSPISNCQRSKSAIFISRNINSNINSLLRLRVGTHIIYIYIYIGRALHTGSRNENNIG